MYSKMVTTTWFWVVGGVEVILAWILLFTPRLSDFGLIWTSHSISTFLISHYKYNEWLDKVEICIHHLQPMPHPGFWVMIGDNFGFSPQHFTPRWSVCGLIEEFHSISTLPMSHHKYIERLENVEIGELALKWSPQRVFQSQVGSKLACPLSTFDTKIEWVWTDLGNSQHLNLSILSPWV